MIKIFVVGNSRSGTAMMGRILGNHPDVFTFKELHFFGRLWTPNSNIANFSKEKASKLIAQLICLQRKGYAQQNKYFQFIEESQKLLEKISDSKLTPEIAFENFLLYEASMNSKSISCCQTPRNVFYIGDILENMKDARIVNMIRDPRDILLSQKRKWKLYKQKEKISLQELIRTWNNYHPITISMLWNSSIRAFNRYSDNPFVYSVKFENLLRNPEKEVKNVCDFLRISYQSNLIEIPQIGSSSEPNRPEKSGIKQHRVKAWKRGGLNSTEIFFCQKITKYYMEQNGYKQVFIRPTLFKQLFYMIKLPIQTVIAFFLNLKRVSSIHEALKRRLK